MKKHVDTKPGGANDASAATRKGGPVAPPKDKQQRPSGALRKGGSKSKKA